MLNVIRVWWIIKVSLFIPINFQAIFSEKRRAQAGHKEAVGQFWGSPTVFHVLDHYCASIDSDNIAGLLRIRSCRDGSQPSIRIGEQIEITIRRLQLFTTVFNYLTTFLKTLFGILFELTEKLILLRISTNVLYAQQKMKPSFLSTIDENKLMSLLNLYLE